ncbi:pulmonary surfactant-associated protein B isoform X2 [Ascaphus truei]|uniref:pulmonary surfactant-associated protein B isoform X2 n=1 Tax=Ascaphus truei TaxID=8439 RepID=UPI003F594379
MERTRLTWICALYVIAAVSGKVLVKDGCAEGPKFWCEDLVTAAQCGAVDHCKETVWKEKEDNLCMECKQIVTNLLNIVKEAPIQDAIKQFLNKECSYLPVSSLVTPCHLLVEQYQGVLITLLENQIGTRGDLPIPLPLCWMCRSFIRRVESTIPKDAIAKAASKLCLFLPGKIAGVCQCLIEKYTVIILDTILGKLGPQLVCGLLFMCSSGENCGADLPVIPVLASEVACDTCLSVTSLVKPTMAKNVTQEEIEDALLRACSNPALDWNECQRFLQQHQTKLSQLLPKPWDHRTTCQEVGACPSGNTAAPEDSGCADGPSYWCISLDTAKQCEAVRHCLTHVWH